MSQQQTDFTPAQIYAAGLHAEHEGRPDYARQYYEFLLAHHPQASETGLARQALERLMPQQGHPLRSNGASPGHAGAPIDRNPAQWSTDPSGGLLLGGAQQNDGGQGRYGRAGVRPEFGSLHVSGGEPRGGEPDQNVVTDRPATQSTPINARGGAVSQPPTRSIASVKGQNVSRRGEAAPDPDDADFGFAHRRTRDEAGGPRARKSRRTDLAVEPLPEVARGFLAGRIVAGLVTMLGTLAIVAGLVLLSASFAGFNQVGVGQLLTSPIGMWSISVLIGSGLIAVLVGQLASAIFAGANSVRDMAQLERFNSEQGTSGN